MITIVNRNKRIAFKNSFDNLLDIEYTNIL